MTQLQPGDVIVTNSTVKDFQRCKRKWWLKHYRRKTRVRYGSPFTVGNFVHDALAEWYAGRLESPLDFINEKQAEETEKFPDYAREIAKDAELAYIMVEGYVEWLEETGADYELESVEPEREMQVQLAPATEPPFGRVIARSKLDGKVRTRDGWFAFLEHKSVQNFVDLPSIARMDPQLLMYELQEYLEWWEEQQKSLDATEKLIPADSQKALAGGAIFNLLRKVKRTARAKPPFYFREPVRHNVEQLRSHWKHVVAEARDMQLRIARLDAGEDHHVVAPPTVRTTCRWDCEFFEVCPLFDDGSDAESVIAAEYEDHDPLERYADDLGASSDG
jgi:hypothetical protein